jgi:signal transduction histidine kinase
VTDEQQRTLEQVKESSDQLLELITNLLELTTLKRGGLEVQVSGFDPREALREAVGSTPGRSDGVVLRVEEPVVVPMMLSDRGKVVKLVATLLGNAYKFTHTGEVVASVAVHEGRVTFRVADTGIGIPDEAQQYVFDEFRQVDGSATRIYGGSGLGLALARRLARLLGGDIALASQPGMGSTFTAELPLAYEYDVS